MAGQSPTKDSLPSTKACETCRSLKVRCIPDNTSGSKRCQRCAKSDRECIFPMSKKRKQRKTTDLRIAELESEIRSMKGHPGRHETGYGAVNGHTDGISPSSFGASLGSTVEEIHKDGPMRSSTEPRPTPQPDLIDAVAIDMATATELFEIYKRDLVEHYPVVVFPIDYSVEQLRREKPTLFLAVMAAAAGKSHPHLSAALNTQALQVYATRIFLNSEKSLELVQSMIITAVWYAASDGRSQHKIVQYVHMAATMASEFGLGTQPPQSETVPVQSLDSQLIRTQEAYTTSFSQAETYDTEIEGRRTFLACYMICCGFAVSMRRPNMLKYSKQMDDHVNFLQTSSAAVPSDKRLAAWVELLHMSEDIATAFSFDDSTKIANIEDRWTQRLLKKFEHRLSNWRINLKPGTMNGSLAIIYHHLNVFLHEIALHGEYKPDDFIPPHQFEEVHSDKSRTNSSMAHLQAIIQCVTSSQSLIENFLQMDVKLLRTLPIFNYVRLSYVVFVLEMLAKTHAFDAFLNRESLQLDHYVALIIDHLERVARPVNCKIPLIFLGLFRKLQTWHQKPGNMPAASDRPSIETMTSSNRTDNSDGGSPGIQSNSFQHPNMDQPNMPNHLLSPPGQAEAAHVYEPLLDFSGVYQVDFDPSNLFVFNGIDGMTTGSMDDVWPMDYSVPTVDSQGQQTGAADG